MAVRATSQQAREMRAKEELAYRRGLVREFLERAQYVEDLVNRYYASPDRTRVEGSSTNDLWFIQKYVSIVMPALKWPAEHYAKVMNDLLWDDAATTFTDAQDQMWEPRNSFLHAAENEVVLQPGTLTSGWLKKR
jgi:hypothetical protein